MGQTVFLTNPPTWYIAYLSYEQRSQGYMVYLFTLVTCRVRETKDR